MTDSLCHYCDDDRVFGDIVEVGEGADFGDAIQGTLGSADACVKLTGDKWLDASDDEGTRRPEDPDEWVVRNIAAALGVGIPT